MKPLLFTFFKGQFLKKLEGEKLDLKPKQLRGPNRIDWWKKKLRRKISCRCTLWIIDFLDNDDREVRDVNNDVTGHSAQSPEISSQICRNLEKENMKCVQNT